MKRIIFVMIGCITILFLAACKADESDLSVLAGMNGNAEVTISLFMDGMCKSLASADFATAAFNYNFISQTHPMIKRNFNIIHCLSKMAL